MKKIKHKAERQFAKWLESQGKTAIYEPHKLNLGVPYKKWHGNRQYTPDFYCPEDDIYYEVSNTRQAASLSWRKIDLLKASLPHIKVVMVNPNGNIYTRHDYDKNPHWKRRALKLLGQKSGENLRRRLFHFEHDDKYEIVLCQDAAYAQFLVLRKKAYLATGDVNKRKCLRCDKWDYPSCLLKVQETLGGATYHHRSCFNEQMRLRQEKHRRAAGVPVRGWGGPGGFKITDDEIETMKLMLTHGFTHVVIAKRYGVTTSYVSKVNGGRGRKNTSGSITGGP